MGRAPISDDLRDLMLKGRKHKLSKGQIIQATDRLSAFHYISKGYVKRYLITNDGAIGVQVLYGPGEFFALTLAFKLLNNQEIYEGPEVYYYEAMCDTEVYRVNAEEVINAIKENPILYKGLFIEAGNRLHSTLHGLENLTLKSSYRRVAHQLAYFAQQYGEKRPEGIKIQIPLTHQELANILSLTRETISNSMIQLRQKKLIKTGRYVVIPKLKALEDEAFS